MVDGSDEQEIIQVDEKLTLAMLFGFITGRSALGITFTGTLSLFLKNFLIYLVLVVLNTGMFSTWYL